MHIYGKDQQAFHLTRTETEKWFSRANTILVAAQLACFLAAIIRTAINASNSMTNSFFSSSQLNLRPAYLQPDCVYNVTRTHAFFRQVNFVMHPDNIGYFVSRGAQNIRYLLALTGVHFVLSTINRVWFETNTYEIRYHFTVFHKDMVTTWELLLLVLCIVVVFGVNEENYIMERYLEHCYPDAVLQHNFYNSVQPYIELYVSFFLSLGFTVINAIVALVKLLKKNPHDELVKADMQRMKEMQAAQAAAAASATAAGQSQEVPASAADSLKKAGAQYSTPSHRTAEPHGAARSAAESVDADRVGPPRAARDVVARLDRAWAAEAPREAAPPHTPPRGHPTNAEDVTPVVAGHSNGSSILTPFVQERVDSAEEAGQVRSGNVATDTAHDAAPTRHSSNSLRIPTDTDEARAVAAAATDSAPPAPEAVNARSSAVRDAVAARYGSRLQRRTVSPTPPPPPPLLPGSGLTSRDPTRGPPVAPVPSEHTEDTIEL